MCAIALATAHLPQKSILTPVTVPPEHVHDTWPQAGNVK